ncbi:DUF7882 family protein [Planctomonas psychrotolerans]|uniref:DUF7882 family protein n=1 Tax=Planctomonas psychrotolerans TaxID=2528712 RepID=UPI001D0D186E|nr:ATP-dependent DNA ligase [Planctomonas psychrotolerans]
MEYRTMGKMIYGPQGDEIQFDDRLLAHLQVAIITKFRRNECFAFTFVHAMEEGSGRSTIWLHPTVPLRFRYAGTREAKLNRDWLERLLVSANSTTGLRPVDEPAPESASVVP